MRDRSLPPIISINVRVDSSLKQYTLDQEALDKMAEEAVEMSKEGTVSLTCYLKFRKQVLDYCHSQNAQETVVIFGGEERGKAEVIIRARKPTDPPLVTGRKLSCLNVPYGCLRYAGFEDGAEGGYGWGIESFRPANRPFKLSEKMMIPTKALQVLTGNDGEADRDPQDVRSEQSILDKLKSNPVPWREWTENETPIITEDEDKKVCDVSLP